MFLHRGMILLCGVCYSYRKCICVVRLMKCSNPVHDRVFSKSKGPLLDERVSQRMSRPGLSESNYIRNFQLFEHSRKIICKFKQPV